MFISSTRAAGPLLKVRVVADTSQIYLVENIVSSSFLSGHTGLLMQGVSSVLEDLTFSILSGLAS